ncbi:hypothetical protein BDN72DRAFT_157671 [Pluteus cervinus]|uniref:Uncharacterized protein n=1 Tax=Pluteus cervinus TaxID=181527 RepID=A0ACD3AMS5_9AGAR|nr:hypothetical protein BDN72DRAFT_157671 [Pluteus cervinus]
MGAFHLPPKETLPPLPMRESGRITEECRRISEPKSKLDHAVVILNILSYLQAYFDSEQDVHFFVLIGSHRLLESTLEDDYTPDIVSYTSRSELVQRYLHQLCDNPFEELPLGDLPFWGEVTSVGTLPKTAARQRPITDFCDALLRHRPDLARGVGLCVRRNGFQFWEVTSSGYSSTEQYTWSDVDITVLQAFVATVYRVSNDRYMPISFVPDSIHLWALHHDGIAYDLTPFYAGHYPGRGTWVATGFEAAHPEKQLIFKFYWRDCDAEWDEGELYGAAHQGGTIPGLVKPLVFVRTGFMISSESPSGEKVQKRELVFLVSDIVCRRLNHCSSVMEILDAIYDALETHKGMCKRGILHRDISFGNVGLPERIEASYLGDTSNNNANLPFSILLDLDSATKLPVNEGNCTNRAGTPMFMSHELTKKPGYHPPSILDFVSPSVVEFTQRNILEVELQPGSPQLLLDALKRHQEDVLDMLSNMTYHTSSMEEFHVDINPFKHTSRCEGSPDSAAEQSLPTGPSHQPHHDVESMFWLLWFLLARANPVKAEEPPTAFLDAYNNFCTSMFTHKVGSFDSRDELFRVNAAWTVHPLVSGVTTTLRNMQVLVQFPHTEWRRAYRESMPWDFLHRLMQFWILVDKQELLRSESLHGIPLDTTAPRHAHVHYPTFTQTPQNDEVLRPTPKVADDDVNYRIIDKVAKMPPDLRRRYELCSQAARRLRADLSCSEKWYDADVSTSKKPRNWWSS